MKICNLSDGEKKVRTRLKIAISFFIIVVFLYGFPLATSLDGLSPPFKVSRIFFFEDVYTTSPIFVQKGIIYTAVVSQGKVESRVVAFNAENGSLLWDFKVTSFVRASLTMENDLVLFATEDGEIYALNVKGELLWSRNLTNGSETGIEDVQPAVAYGLVYFGTSYEPGYLYALNATTGALAWQFPIRISPLGRIVTGNKMVYAVNNEGMQIYALDVNGRLKWVSEERGLSLHLYKENVLYATAAQNNRLLAFEAGNGTVLWEFTGGRIKILTLQDHLLYVYSRDDQATVFAFDAKTGTQKQKTALNVQKVYTPYGMADGIFYGWLSLHETRFLTAFNITTGKPMWSYPLNKTEGGSKRGIENYVAREGSFVIAKDFIVCSEWRVLEWEKEEGVFPKKTATSYVIFEKTEDWWSDSRSRSVSYIEKRVFDGWTRIQVLWSNAPITVMTNSTVGRVSFDEEDQKIIIEVAGIDGTRGFMNITTPRLFVPSPSDISLYLNSQPIDFNFTQKDSHNVAEISYSHSAQEIFIKLPFRQGETPKKFCISPSTLVPEPLPYHWILVGVAVILLSVVFLVIVFKRSRS
jgi:outer membrane protein assembly factor BamB